MVSELVSTPGRRGADFALGPGRVERKNAFHVVTALAGMARGAESRFHRYSKGRYDELRDRGDRNRRLDPLSDPSALTGRSQVHRGAS